MTVAEAQTRLALVRTAINSAIAAGGVTSYTINGRSTNRDLKWLTQQEALLETFVTRNSSTGGCPVAQSRRPE